MLFNIVLCRSLYFKAPIKYIFVFNIFNVVQCSCYIELLLLMEIINYCVNKLPNFLFSLFIDVYVIYHYENK